MREIKYIVLHCTATDQDAKTENIVKYWKNNLGWKNPGYHRLIEPDGTIQDLHPIDKVSNGVKGYNSNALNISYIGVKDGDDRTPEQIKSMEKLVISYARRFPEASILGHKDFPKVTKRCPNFEVEDFLEEIGLEDMFKKF